MAKKRNYGYITNKERNKRVRQSNQSYGLRKLFISLTVGVLVLLIAFGVATLASYAGKIHELLDQKATMNSKEFVQQLCSIPLSVASYKALDGGSFYVGLSGFGWFMAILTAITVGLSVVSLVLMILMKSPKAAKANLSRLQSAALSGKKLDKDVNAAQVYRDRATNTKKMKKIEEERKEEGKHKFDWTKKAKKNKKDKKKDKKDKNKK